MAVRFSWRPRDVANWVAASLFWLLVFNLEGSSTIFKHQNEDDARIVDEPTILLHYENETKIINNELETPQMYVDNQDERKETVHVMLGLSGKIPDFLAEFEVAMKSILLNAPLDSGLTIHVVADSRAYKALPEAYERTEVKTWRTRQPIEIRSYNVQSNIWKWIQILKTILHGTPDIAPHTIGTYFRLFIDHVLDQDVKHIIYLDTDVVVLANLGELWTYINPDSLFAWGKNMCAGFMVLNVDKMEQMRNITSNLNLKAIYKQKSIFNDQEILRALNLNYPQNITLLPPAWDISVADIWKDENRAGGLVNARPEAGMLHFNGGSNSPDSWFSSHGRANEPRWANDWGIAQYYARLPWKWARFMAKSQIGAGEGYLVQMKYNANATATL